MVRSFRAASKSVEGWFVFLLETHLIYLSSADTIFSSEELLCGGGPSILSSLPPLKTDKMALNTCRTFQIIIDYFLRY